MTERTMLMASQWLSLLTPITMPKLGPTSPNSPLSQHTATWRHFLPIATIVCVFWFVWRQFGREQLALDPYSHLANYCAHVPAITQDEFLGRQDLLAAALRDLGAAAYVAEPGANTLFYANFSQAHWRLSERPLLLAVSPRPADSGARLSIVTPKVAIIQMSPSLHVRSYQTSSRRRVQDNYRFPLVNLLQLNMQNGLKKGTLTPFCSLHFTPFQTTTPSMWTAASANSLWTAFNVSPHPSKFYLLLSP